MQIFAIIRPSTLIKKVSGLSVFQRAAVHCNGLITLPGSWKARVQPERVVTGLQRVMEVLQSSWFWCFVTEDGDSDGPQDTYPGDTTRLNFELHKPDEMKPGVFQSCCVYQLGSWTGLRTGIFKNKSWGFVSGVWNPTLIPQFKWSHGQSLFWPALIPFCPFLVQTWEVLSSPSWMVLL